MNGKSILITGGTGTFGQAFSKHLLEHADPRRVIIFSRDEQKQFHQRTDNPDPRMRWWIGDVRDKDRLKMAFRGVDIVVHAAALKHVPTGEVTPIETIKTNVMGAQNVVEAAIEADVEKVLALSTDKACGPINLYGASKLAADKLFIASNPLAPVTRFSCVRYGNIANSRGSVIPFFLKMKRTGVLPITDYRMTRFLLTIEQAVEFVYQRLLDMTGGELFVPKCPSVNIENLARLIGGEGYQYPEIGIRPGEKLHEALISQEDGRNTVFNGKYHAILPENGWFKNVYNMDFEPLPSTFPGYRSDNNPWWLTDDEIMEIVNELESNQSFPT